MEAVLFIPGGSVEQGHLVQCDTDVKEVVVAFSRSGSSMHVRVLIANPSNR